MENMLGDKASKSRSSSFYIENLLGSPLRTGTRSPEVCAGRLGRSCKSPRQPFQQIKLVTFVWSLKSI